VSDYGVYREFAHTHNAKNAATIPGFTLAFQCHSDRIQLEHNFAVLRDFG